MSQPILDSLRSFIRSPYKLAPRLRLSAKHTVLTTLIVSMAITQSGCFTQSYATRQIATHTPVLNDSISAIASIDDQKKHQYLFLGKKYSYVVTSGGDDLAQVAQSSIANRITIYLKSGKWPGLELQGNNFSGDVELRLYGVTVTDASTIESANALGFKLFVPPKSMSTGPESAFAARTYQLDVPVAGHLENAVKLDAGTLNRPVPIYFWSATSGGRDHSYDGRSGAVVLDIITAPIQVLGVLGGITVVSVACSFYDPKKHNGNPCIE